MLKNINVFQTSPNTKLYTVLTQFEHVSVTLFFFAHVHTTAVCVFILLVSMYLLHRYSVARCDTPSICGMPMILRFRQIIFFSKFLYGWVLLQSRSE